MNESPKIQNPALAGTGSESNNNAILNYSSPDDIFQVNEPKNGENCFDILDSFGYCAPKSNPIRCPFADHPDEHPSFSISNDGIFFQCHTPSCGRKGNAKQLRTMLKSAGCKKEYPDTCRSHERRIDKIYPYRDESDELVYEVIRYYPKDFRSRRPDPARLAEYIWDMEGIKKQLYRLPELLASPTDEPIIVVEGEGCVDDVCSLGLTSTTNSGGAGKFPADSAIYFKDRNVIIIPDNDPPGGKHVIDVAKKLLHVAKSVKLLELTGLPQKGDVSDWLDIERKLSPGITNEDLRNKLLGLADKAPIYTGPENVSPEASEEWPDPIPLKAFSGGTEPWSPDVFPPELVAMDKAISENMNVSAEMVSPAILGVASIALGNAVELKIKADHVTHGNLYIMQIAAPGQKKSPVYRLLQEPLQRIQKRLGEEFVEEKIKHAAKVFRAKEELKNMNKPSPRSARPIKNVTPDNSGDSIVVDVEIEQEQKENQQIKLLKEGVKK